MASNDYQFFTHWRVRGTVEEVYAILSNAPEYVRWWPDVYLRVEPVCSGLCEGVGTRGRLLTKGWLPYRLRWEYHIIDNRRPYGFTIEATGDFDGRGIWQLRQDGEMTDILFDWKVRANKPLLKYLSFLMKPAFRANHEWAMQRGYVRLQEELARRKESAH